jgi:adenylate cyclase
MAIEIERKFLVLNDRWRNAISATIPIQQGYFCNTESVSIRVRITAEEACLNFKNSNIGIKRSEYGYPIPRSDAQEMIEQLCLKPIIEKIRYLVIVDGHTWEIDVFAGDNSGLIVAELELESEHDTFSRPDWLGKEVTEQQRYYNPYLVEHPYSQWTNK